LLPDANWFARRRLWFGVLFTKPWMQLEHIPPEQAAAMKGAAYCLSLRHVVRSKSHHRLRSCPTLCLAARDHRRTRNFSGVLLWIGIVGPITYTTSMYEMRPLIFS